MLLGCYIRTMFKQPGWSSPFFSMVLFKILVRGSFTMQSALMIICSDCSKLTALSAVIKQIDFLLSIRELLRENFLTYPYRFAFIFSVIEAHSQYTICIVIMFNMQWCKQISDSSQIKITTWKQKYKYSFIREVI